MEDYKLMKNFLENISEDDFFSRVNLHLHSCASDGMLSPKEIVAQAKANGLRMISITDHNTMRAYDEIDLEDKDIKIVKGIEFDCWDGYVFMHILGYDVDFECEELKKLYAHHKCSTEYDIIRIFPRRSAKRVIQAIKKAGGMAVVAHPCCMWTFNMDNTIKRLISYGLEGIEVYYPYRRHRRIIKFYDCENIKKLAEKYSLLKTGGTDFHKDDLSCDTFNFV